MVLHSVFETQKTPVASTEPPSSPQPPMSSSVPSSKPQPLRSLVFSNFKWPLEYPSSTTASNHHHRFCNVLSESTPDSEPHANDLPAVNEDHSSLAVRKLADSTLFPGSEPQLAHPLKYDHHLFGKLAGSTRTHSKSRCRNDPGPGVTNGLSFVGSSERLIVKEAKKISENKSANSGRVMLKPGDKSKAPDPKPKIYIRISTKNKSTAADGVAKATEQTSPVAVEVKELPPKPWNLRPKKPSPKTLHGDGVGVALRAGGAPAQETKTQHPVRASARARKGTNSKVSETIPRLCIALSKEEIEEDIFMLTGSKPARRPKKRAKTVQKQLDSVFPGLWLTSITPESYNVSVAPGKGN
ncbi:hypothetical protein I3843_14G023700 [Carya illinoinensis]|uniref:Uncharacterized protein n=1 Tax=Carya illinoinensis TaxID=32201 RepID=A0A922A9N0_CARIL|nr:hypothetical protein I3760_14G023800 [Carya illinoinensis]KAG6677407.1 hypothetical protein I3842_14G024500 [Carya illinoinensis]KAG7946149.1 hypothetical protein I3843_14G023700 [Carya illinoinensis]